MVECECIVELMLIYFNVLKEILSESADLKKIVINRCRTVYSFFVFGILTKP